VSIHFNSRFLGLLGWLDRVLETQDCKCPLCRSGEYLCTTEELTPELQVMNMHTKFYHVHKDNVEAVVPDAERATSPTPNRPCAIEPAGGDSTAGETLDNPQPKE